LIERTIGRIERARAFDPTMHEKLKTLEEVMAWAHARRLSLVDVVTQDEYTHDVVVAAGAEYIVFDAT